MQARSAPDAPPAAEETAAPESPIDAIESMAVVPREEPALRLRSGRTVSVDPRDPDALTVRAPDGVVELSVRFTAEGPVLRFVSASIELSAARDVSIDCERFNLRASGAARVEGDSVEIESTRGDVLVRANDDARIMGERVRLNG